MEISVPINWDKNLIKKIKKENVTESYGKLSEDFIGGGRFSCLLPRVSKSYIKEYIQIIHHHNLNFNYLLNATCLDNREWTINGQKEIRTFLDWLVNIEVDSVTVANPYLLQLTKKNYPKLKVCISDGAEINTVKIARYWQDLGADEITLSFTDINRHFILLREIRKNVFCKIRLIANNICLSNCPNHFYHSLLSSHGSQSKHFTKGFIIDYCSLSCRYRQITDPVNFILAPWIRPEDIHYYEKIGIDTIKLVDRAMDTETISLITDAYSRRYYNGNLLDLLGADPAKNIKFKKLTLSYKLNYFFRPFFINVFKLFRHRKVLSARQVYIDNRALDGFIDYFLQNNCTIISCDDCGYCRKIADAVVKIDKIYQKKNSDWFSKFLNDVITGDIFKYWG